jgi:phosphoribosylamine--glycine ligase
VAPDRATAEAAVEAAMVDKSFGEAGSRVVLEELMTGPEVSFFIVANGVDYVPLLSAQDHKRIFDDDRGPNTGGMGAFAPSPLMTPDIERRVIDAIVRPVLEGMGREGYPYRGFLYVGLMLTDDGPKVIEFNVRFGDPEAQVVLPMLDEDLSWLLGAAVTGALPIRPARLKREPHVAVVLAAGGYPRAVEIGRPISGLESAVRVPGALIFHAGTARENGRIVTAGGRVLTVVGRGARFEDAIRTAYEAAALIQFDGMQFRADIGRKALAQ